ncbi:MAG: peptide ABC transporter substrate-binding protein, partial [Cyanobacteria bacterium J06635_13]
ASQELDPERRNQLFIQMNDLLIEDAAVIPLVHRADVMAYGNSLTGYEPTAWDMRTWDIANWKRQ